MFHISFGDFSPAVYIRNYTQEVIEPYANASKIYDQELLRPLLVEVFKWMEFEVSQELMRVLAFGRDKYIRITLEEMVSQKLCRLTTSWKSTLEKILSFDMLRR